jgi:hypothetical protein
MTPQDLARLVREHRWASVRVLPDGRLVGVSLMLWGNARLWVGDGTTIDDSY